MPQETQAILCPYCGHTQRRMDRCDACGGSFDPVSRRGVAVNMGPWFLHDQRVPFRPGFNYTSMKRLIGAGKVTADSIVRGPSTQQLWAPARLTPGLAHLLGHCPRCEADVAPGDPQCPQCEQLFQVESAYNELGLPFKSGAESRAAQVELDREVERTGGRSRALKLWHHPDVPMLALCPYCGGWQKNSDSCATCGGVFDQLSQRATIIAMGPWFVRNKRFPYLPGCSYDLMRRQIAAKRIDASTIVRGHTTRQFWSVARNVPGLSHLVGYCWSCGAAAKADDPRCGSCGSPFGGVDAQNSLGLPFASEAEALAAEQALEEQFNPMMPPTPVAPPPVPAAFAGGALPTGINSMMHAAAGQSAFSGLDRASLAVIAAATLPDAADKPQQVPVARSRRRRKPGRRQMVVAGLVAILLIGVIAGISMIAGSGDDAAPVDPSKTAVNTKDGAKDGARIKPGPVEPEPVTPVTPTDPQVIRTQTQAAWQSVRDLSREGQVGLALDNIGDLLARADAMYDEGQAEKAAGVYQEAMKEIQTVRDKVVQREEATVARNGAAKLLITTDPTDLPAAGIMLFEQNKMQFDEAQIYFDSGEFAQSRDLWKSVEQGLAKLPERARGMARAQAAEAKYRATLDRDLDDAMLQLAGGQAWRQVSQQVAQARMAAMNESWQEAVDGFEAAAAAAPAVMKAAKPLAVRYWTCLAGQVGARAWHEHIEDTTLDPRLRGMLRPLLLRLRVPVAAIDQAMLEPVSRNQAMKLLLTDPADAIQKNHGEFAINTYQLGVHLISLSRLLTVDNGNLADDRQVEIAKRLADLQETVRGAGLNQAMTDRIDALTRDSTNLSGAARITQAKKACDDLIATLASAEQAIGMWKP